MYYNFDTSNENAAVAALLVYAVYRSRDVKRFKVTPEMWSTVERGIKSVAKRATDLGEFLERLKPKLACSSIKPKWASTMPEGMVTMKIDPLTGELIQVADQGKRQFLTDVIEQADHRKVLDVLYKKAALVVLLVRDRLEREKPIESRFIEAEEEVDQIDI